MNPNYNTEKARLRPGVDSMTNDEPVPGMRSVRVRRKRLEERILQVLGACYFRLSYVEDWEWEVGVGGRGVSREGGYVYGK